MNIVPFTIAVLLAAIVQPALARAAEVSSIHAVLITATDLKREADPKLARYEAELQRNIPLSSFRFVGEGSAPVTVGKPSNLGLSGGHRLVLEKEKGGGRGTRVKVLWLKGSEEVFNITLTLDPGGTTVLGRRAAGDGPTPIVLVIAR